MRTSDAAVFQVITYNEFGEVINDSSPGFQPFGFAGGIADSSGVLTIGFKARRYDPHVGRWLSQDPIGFAGGTTNLYQYTMNDPVNYIDPSGLSVLYVSAGGLASLAQNLFSTTGNVRSSTIGFGFDTDTLKFFKFVSTGTGNQTVGAYGGVGFTAGYYSGNMCEFMGKGTDTGVSVGYGYWGAGAHVTESSGKKGLSLDFFGPGYGISSYRQNTNTLSP